MTTVDSIFALYTDRKGFTKKMVIDYPPPPYYQFIEIPTIDRSIECGDLPQVLDVQKVNFRLQEVRSGIAYYVEE